MKANIQVHQRKTRIGDGLIVSNTQYTNFQFPKHFHNYYTILLIEKGVNVGFTGKQSYKLGPGSMLIINPGEVHAGNSLDKNFLRFSSMKIERYQLVEILERNGINVRGDIIFTNEPFKNPRLSSKIRTALDAKANTLQEESSILDFVFDLAAHYRLTESQIPEEQLNLHYLARARDYIHDNYSEELTLEEIAANSNISAYHLLRQFRAFFGLTPFAYLRNLRVEKAITRLSTTESITELAHELGFFDHSHFIKNFRKITGVVPSAYKRMNVC